MLAACTGGGEKTGEEGLVRTDLGDVTTDADGFVDVPVEVTADGVSIGVYCGPYGYDTLATADAILDPGEATIFDDEDPQATAMRVGVTEDLLPMVIPVSPDLDVAAGTYLFQLYLDVSEPTTMGCQAVERIAAPNSPATIDLNFVFVGVSEASGLDGSSGESLLEDVVADVASTWEGALEIGEITYNDFSGDASTYQVIDDDQEFGSLLRTVEDGRTVTVFFVEEIRTDDAATILGLAGGPPGAAAVGGTSKSGVVVSVADFADDPMLVSRIIAHEGGHFLGLFHTSEKTGDEHDPISDTPECTDAGDGTDACTGKGAENVMFWTGGGDSVSLSDDQAWVVQRSAAVE